MIVPPGDFADRPGLRDPAPGPGTRGHTPGQQHDLLSELLRNIRLNGERIAAHGPLDSFSVGYRGVGTLHIVDEGEVLLRLDGTGQAERAGAGDVILVPRGDAHHVGDVGGYVDANGDMDAPAGAHSGGHAPATAPVAVPGAVVPGGDATGNVGPGTALPPNTPPPQAASAPPPARWLCGTFAIGDPRASHLLASLPPVIVLRGAGGPALEGLDVARRMIMIEVDAPSQGSAVMVARILDLLFIQVLRAWAAGTGAEPNWLAGALDPEIGPALTAIHRTPGHDWTVEELARACCLSRSAFAARFATRVGKPPATYLAHVRLDAAADLLHNTTLPVASIGEDVGYTSEAAFSRAFKHRYGQPPTLWRRTHQAPEA